jgi:PIN domain nuclease of toxin-antitoxin system
LIVLDTHVVVWATIAPERLGRRAARAIGRARPGELAIASISLWELVFLFARGRIRHRGTVEQALRSILAATRVAIREITPEIALLAHQLPATFPSDPQDRLIAATALAEGVPLVTSDEAIRSSASVRTIW